MPNDTSSEAIERAAIDVLRGFGFGWTIIVTCAVPQVNDAGPGGVPAGRASAAQIRQSAGGAAVGVARAARSAGAPLKLIETLTALEAVAAIGARELTCEALVRACLDRIFSQAAGDTRRAPRP